MSQVTLESKISFQIVILPKYGGINTFSFGFKIYCFLILFLTSE